MKKAITIALLFTICLAASSQKKENGSKEQLLSELSASACRCIDSISVYNKPRSEVVKEINKCIGAQANAYQLGAQLMNLDLLKDTAATGKDGKKQINISLNMDENSEGYKNAYYEMERYLMANCKSLKEKIASNDRQSEKSLSANPMALEFYNKGIDESQKENYKGAIKYFEKAIKNDPEFAFAYDNMGISYRKLGDYDKALEAYQNSLKIDPYGLMPLQNIAIVYQYKKDYQAAIKAYEKLAEIDDKNPEIFYGIGQVYTVSLQDYEKGLDNICKAYNLYVAAKSPYRADAEKLIQMVYAEMKKQGKEDKFREILKTNNITSN